MIRRLFRLWWERRALCGAPCRIKNVGPCIRPKGHVSWEEDKSPLWHADGTGYVWSDHPFFRWNFMGPVRNLEVKCRHRGGNEDCPELCRTVYGTVFRSWTFTEGTTFRTTL